MSNRPAIGTWLGSCARAIGKGWRWVVSLIRRSLQFRVVAATILLTSFAIYGVGTYMSQEIAKGLFEKRLSSATKITDQFAQQLNAFSDDEAATSQGDLSTTLRTTLADQMSSSTLPLRAVALEPMEGATSVSPISETQKNKPPYSVKQLSPDLIESVKDAGGEQRYQAMELSNYDGSVDPGLAIGTLVTIPGAGQFQLYVISDLTEEQNTLEFVQRAMVISGLVLIVLVAAIAWTVANIVVRPVRVAADVSHTLASGDLDRRMPVHGEDELATLARSFNDMASALQDQITRMEALSVLQRRFVSDVSHELRTPLTTIRIAGELMYEAREDFDPVTARSAELLHSQVQRFEALLADLLEISRFDAGAAALDAAADDLVSVVNKVVESVEVVAEQAGTPVIIHGPSAPMMAAIDSRRIERIVRNLVVNAIEHSEGKPVDIYLAADADAVAVSVRDHGVGMDRSQVERVFDRFWRADPARQRTLGGTGLGLAISLEDAHLHAGWLQAWGRPGEGSCFRLTIPRRPGHELETSPLPLPPADASSAARKDDEVIEPLSSDSSVRLNTGSLPVLPVRAETSLNSRESSSNPRDNHA
ncbi:MtrAB system histidine kinase MtrB [Saxibacter everestensis]|uniref:Sensor histidine kinase MtrB n=1 Tax=Saxibacter everestensis TaxID=2909229 RepID=A0ABY8QQQ5_9MICO|nr:MtrAB system histidine kinase MtrB [Brevibacteriaceae bacterium ZFBP1038]